MQQRQLTYYIPLAIMSQTGAIQQMIAREATNVNGECKITYESVFEVAETRSLMVLTMFVACERCDYIHRAMQSAIAIALSVYSSDTDIVRVTDIPVAMRDFNAKEIL